MKGFLVFMLTMLVAASFAFAGTNESYVDQVGTDNAATVNQTTGPHLSNITQGTIGNGSTDGVATVDQLGQDNDSYIMQTGYDNTADVDQSGKRNDSDIDQSEVVATADGSTATVDQSGKDDWSGVTQVNGFIGGNTATVTQTSDGGDFYGDANHTSEIYQWGGLNSATVTQDGDDEESHVGQVGTSNTATVDQSGNSDNDSWVNQYGLDNTADVDQVGSFNDATISQGMEFSWADGNFGAIDQTGGAADNEATINQSGDDNNTRIVQEDGPNIATFNSASDGNGQRDLITDGYTEGNIILQTGADNTATVNQYAGYMAGDNTAWISQDNNDTAVVHQYGSGGDAYVNQQ